MQSAVMSANMGGGPAAGAAAQCFADELQGKPNALLEGGQDGKQGGNPDKGTSDPRSAAAWNQGWFSMGILRRSLCSRWGDFVRGNGLFLLWRRFAGHRRT